MTNLTRPSEHFDEFELTPDVPPPVKEPLAQHLRSYYSGVTFVNTNSTSLVFSKDNKMKVNSLLKSVPELENAREVAWFKEVDDVTMLYIPATITNRTVLVKCIRIGDSGDWQIMSIHMISF